MNANTIATHYDKLTPRERWPLIMSASNRGDEAEYKRLMQSAPRWQLVARDHFPVAMAFRELGDFTLIELLSLAALFWCSSSCLQSPTNGAKAEQLFRMHAGAFGVLWMAWNQFREGLRLDADACYFKLTPGEPVLELTAEAIKRIEFAPDERQGQTEQVKEQLQKLRECFEARVRFWGPS
jgi:hypothetical protein